MATVAFDNAAKSVQTATASSSISMAITPGACLIVATMTASTAGISAVAANGTPLTRLIGADATFLSGPKVELWCVTASPSGTVSISANVIGGAAPTMQIMAASYTNVNMVGDPWATSASLNATSPTPGFDLTFSTTTNGVCVFAGAATQTITAMNMTNRLNDAAHKAFAFCDTVGPASSFVATISAQDTITIGAALVGVNLMGSMSATFTIGHIALRGTGL